MQAGRRRLTITRSATVPRGADELHVHQGEGKGASRVFLPADCCRKGGVPSPGLARLATNGDQPVGRVTLSTAAVRRGDHRSHVRVIRRAGSRAWAGAATVERG